jgi:30S ribosome assembly GTPase
LGGRSLINNPACIGCGTHIQTENPKEHGFAPPSALEKEVIICQRCFRLKNYNELQPVSLTDDDFLRILNSLGKEQGLIIKIVDIFDFNGSWLPGLHRFVGSNPILLVANKVDLLPKSVKKNRVIHWLKQESRKLGLQPIDVLLVSAHKGTGMAEAMKLKNIVNEKMLM